MSEVEANVSEQAIPTEAPTGDVGSVSQEQTSESSWRNDLPEDLRDHKALQHFGTVNDLAKSHVHAQQMIGKDKIVIPGESATPDEWRELHYKLGLPETSQDYSLDAKLGLAEGLEPDEALVGWFMDEAHKIGLNNNQTQQLLEAWNKNNSELFSVNEEGARQAQEQSAQTLKQEWGNTYDDQLSLSKTVLDTFFQGEDSGEFLETSLADGSRIGDNPNFIKMMAGIGSFIKSRIGEDSIKGLDGVTARNPNELQDELASLMDLNGPYGDKKHPEHESYVRKVAEIHEELYPDAE